MLTRAADPSLLDLEQRGEVGFDGQLERAVRRFLPEIPDDEVLAHPPADIAVAEHHERRVGPPGPGWNRETNTALNGSMRLAANGSGTCWLTRSSRRERNLVSRKNRPWGNPRTMSPVAVEMQNDDPSTRVTALPLPTSAGDSPAKVHGSVISGQHYRGSAPLRGPPVAISPTHVVVIHLTGWPAPFRGRGPPRRGRRHRDPARRRPRRAERRDPRPHGAERLGQVHPGQRPAGQPRVHRHPGPDPPEGPGHHVVADRRAGQSRDVPRLPVSGGDQRGADGPVPEAGAVGPHRHRGPVDARDSASRSWSG